MNIIKTIYSIDRTSMSDIITYEQMLESRRKEQERMQMGRAIWENIV